MKIRLALLVSALLLGSLPAWAEAPKGEPILILDISSYTAGAAFVTPTRQGFDLAEAEINVQGGVLGRPIHFDHVDDTGNPEEAITRLQQHLLQDHPVLFTGCNLANIELAFSSYAKQNKVLEISGCSNSDTAMWQSGHATMFRGTGPMVYSFNRMIAERAATKGKLKWATINQNYAWGRENLAAYKENLAAFQPNASWVAEYWTPIGKIDAGSVVNAILRSGAEAVYTSMWGKDLVQFVREAKKRGLSDHVLIVSDNMGRPEFMEQMGSEIPEGVVTNGTLPLESPVTPSMKAFAEKYGATYHQSVRYTALQAYLTATVIAEALRQAGTTETEKLVRTLNGMKFDSLYGPLTLRAIDHVPDNGVWVGETAIKDGKPVIVNAEYKDGKNYFPPDSYILTLRKP